VARQGSGIPAGGGLPRHDRSFRRFRARDGVATAASGPPGQADLQRGKPPSIRRKVPARWGAIRRRDTGFRSGEVAVSASTEADGGVAWACVERETGTAPWREAQRRRCRCMYGEGSAPARDGSFRRARHGYGRRARDKKRGRAGARPRGKATRFQGSRGGMRESGAWRWSRPASPPGAAPDPGSPGSASPCCGRGTAAGRTRRAFPTGCRSAA
jgi:hypothetical protein